MKTIINKLITLADALDGLGLKKDADAIDQIVIKAARGDEFSSLMSLFDEPTDDPDNKNRRHELSFEDSEEGAPGKKEFDMDDPDLVPIEDDEAPLSKEKASPNRLNMLKRRNELLKLKNKLEQEEEEAEDEEPSDKVELPIATPEDLKAFEDEEDDVVNEANDCMCHETFPNPCKKCLRENVEEEIDELNMILSKEDAALYDSPKEISMADDSMVDKLKDVLKSAPELAKQLLQLVKDNPELLALLAL